MSGVFSSVNLLAELDPRNYSVYQDSMVKAVEMYYDDQRTPPGYQAYPVCFEKSTVIMTITVWWGSIILMLISRRKIRYIWLKQKK